MRPEHESQRRNETQSTLPEYIRTLWRKKLFILIPVVLSGIIAVVGVRFLKPVYMSSAIIRMEDKNYLSDDVSQIVTFEEKRLALDEETLLKIESEIRSSVFLEQVIEHLGIDDNPRLIAAAQAARRTDYPYLSVDEIMYRRLRGMLADKIEVTLHGPGMFRISCYDYNNETCYLLANSIANLFIDSNQRKRLAGLQQASEFSDEQLRVYKKILDDSELRLEELQNQITQLALQDNPVGETNLKFAEEFGGEANLRSAETLNERLDIRIRELEGIVAKTRGRLTDFIGFVPEHELLRTDPEIQELRLGLKSLRETQLRLELGARGVTDMDIKNNRDDISKTERDLQRRYGVIANEVFTDIDVDYRPFIAEYHLQVTILESFEAERTRLVNFIHGFKAKLDRAPRLERQVTKLREEVKNDRELYNSFLAAKTSAQISEAAQSTNLGMTVDILEKAARPVAPVRPNKGNIILLALIFGGTLGVTGLIISEYVDTSFRTVDEIENELGLKVLGAVPSVEPHTSWNETKSRRQQIIWAGTALIIVVVSLVGFYLYGKTAGKKGIEVYRAETTDR